MSHNARNLEQFKNHDMTMMFMIHDALRRELERMARITARADEDPRHVLRTAVGWELFKKFLTIHHTAEDVTVWPVMQRALAGRPTSWRCWTRWRPNTRSSTRCSPTSTRPSPTGTRARSAWAA
ncbi:hypothetical protein GCM10020295_72550 [Streptomyces cinereospinus]